MTDEERQNVLQRLRASAPITKYDAIKAADEIERLAKRVEELERECGRFENELFEARSALAQSDEEPDPTKVICPNCAHQFGAISVADQERLRAQSDAELPKEVRDAWQHYYHEAPVDFDPVAEEIFEAGWKAALAQSDAEPVTLKTQFEAWAFARGHRNFTKLGEGYLLPEIQKDWLAFRAGSAVPRRGLKAQVDNLERRSAW